ncbi:hypothetical protein HH303_03505 [Rhodospirillaceae bacterium KN72]|uniref:FecR protein domain-containing protein n=1 Tax=Pacificispira spongiicola TaxID=2729598 RepID=A0A7Y0DXQ1_9PROT|nr:FecR domain-containing protein [Pacificispira spongiicola]NMM43529.1 hypothetical protein [Pacificispira spongiicola]
MDILSALQAESGSGETFVELNAMGPTVVPGGDDLLLGDYARLGPDLQITLPTGDSVVVVDYFADPTSAPPALQTEAGAVMNGDLVSQLAGPMVPDLQVAQAGTSDALGDPAGHVDQMKGDVVALRGGVEVELGAGDPIYEGDVLVTGAGGAVGIVFADNSTMSMGGEARISIDEMVYDANAGSGSQLFDIVQGAFVFASGQIGHNNPEDVQVRTPVATIGIRGTKYAVNVDQERGDASVTLFEGAVSVSNAAGEVLLNSIGQSTLVSSFNTPPGQVFIMDPDTQTRTYGDAIDYHPNTPQLREDDDGGGNDGIDESDLGAEDLEKLAEELDDLETAAGGPAGVLGGFTESALFLRLLSGVLQGGGLTSGSLADDQADGSSGLAELLNSNNGNDLGNTTGPDTSGPITNLSISGRSDPYTYSSGLSVNIQGGSGLSDHFTISVPDSVGGTSWGVTQSGTTVSITGEATDGSSTFNMNGVEELSLDLGASPDQVTIGDLSNTDIAQSTVYIHAGEGDDVVTGENVGKRLVIEGEGGDDTLTGSNRNDDIYGGAGNDTLDGGTGNDLLDGGAGDDTITVSLTGGEVEPVELTADEIEAASDEALAAINRTVDIVRGGEGNDTVIVTFDADMAADPAFVQDLFALKAFIEENPQGTQTFTALGLEISGVESVEFDGAFPDLDAILPSVTWGEAVEDEPVNLNVSLDGDADSPFLSSLTVTLDGIPEGAVLTLPNGATYDGGSVITLEIGDGEGQVTEEDLANLTVTLPENYSGTLSVTASVSVENELLGTSGGGEAPETEVVVAAVADGADVTLTDASGLEDGTIPLSIDVTQLDESEDVTISIGGLPEDAVLLDSAGNELDSSNLTLADLDGIRVRPGPNYSGSFDLTVTVTTTDGDATSTDTQTLTVDVAAIADGADLTVSDATGLEDGEIALSIDVTQLDESEDLTISISGLPEDAVLLDSAGNELDASNLSVADLDGIKVRPGLNYSGSFDLTVSVTTADGDATTTDTQTLTVDVTAVADGAEVAVSDATGLEDQAIPLSIDVTQLDEGQDLTISIDGLPDGATLLDGSGNELDAGNLTLADLDGIQVLPGPNYSGSFDLTVTATTTDGNETVTDSQTLTVDVAGVADGAEIGAANVSGVEDGTIALSIDVTKIDDSETTAISIDGLPEGATLLDSAGNELDPDNLALEDLDGLKVQPAADYAGSFDLTVTVTSTDGESTTTDTQTLTVDIGAVADEAVVTVSDALGVEDGAAIPLSISVGQGDADGSETLTVAIQGFVSGTIFYDADDNLVDPTDVPLSALDGLKVLPPANYAGTMTLTVVATSIDGDSISSVEQELSVDVTGIADAPEITASDLVSEGGVDLALSIDAELTDTDGSETLTVEIAGLPQGFKLTDAEGGEYEGSPAQIPVASLSSLTLVPVAGFEGVVPLTITATATEENGDTNTVTQDISLTFTDVALAPVLSVMNATGDEDGDIALTIGAVAGSEGDTVGVTISGLPDGAELTNAAGETFTGSEISLTPDQLVGLTVKPPANSDANFDLTIVATGTDGAQSAVTSATMTVTVDAVADTPSLTVSAVSGLEDQPIDLNIDAHLTDTDGSETLTVRISGLPDGFTLTDEAGNSYSGSPATIPASSVNTLSLVSPLNYVGAVALTVTAIATEANGGDHALVQKNLSVTIGADVDVPTISVLSEATGNEDQDIALDIAIGNIDPNQDTSVSITGLPEGAVLTNAAGDTFTTDPAVLTLDQLDGLMVTPPAGSSVDFALGVSVTTSQGGESVTTAQSLDVTVRAVVDDFTLTLGDAEVVLGRAESTTETGTNGDDTMIGGAGSDTLIGGDGNDHLIGDGDNLDATVSLDIQATLGDLDGSELLTVTISGLPDGVQIYQGGELLATGGAVTLASDALDEVELVVPPGVGDFDLQVTANVTDFDADGGSDSATTTGIISVSVDDGSGLGSNDVLDGGAGDDILDGGAGADTLIGGTGADTLNGGSGNDSLQVTMDGTVVDNVLNVLTDAGGDVVDGGAGTDTLTLKLTVTDWDLLEGVTKAALQDLVDFVSSGDAATMSREFPALNLTVSGIEALNIVDINGEPVPLEAIMPDPEEGITFTGTNATDIAEGTDYDDVMDGGHGDDTLSGLGGDDTILGGSGQDVLNGGDGNDWIDGGQGDDTITGGAGDDTMFGGQGNDRIYADGGSDTVDGGQGDDRITVTIAPEEEGRELNLDGGGNNDTLLIQLSGDQADLNAVLAEIAAAKTASSADPSGTYEIASLGITFTSFETIDVTVDGEAAEYTPELSLDDAVDVQSAALVDGAAVLDDVEIDDVDGSVMTQATVTIASGYQDGDQLSINTDLLQSLGLTVSATTTAAGFVLTLSGNASIASYETALESVKLSSTDSVAEAGDRVLQVSVTDVDGNVSDLSDVTVSVELPDGPVLQDTSDGARDSAVFVTEASNSGATVSEVSNVSETTTNDLVLTVSKYWSGGSGQFEVLVNGTSIGTFSAPQGGHHHSSFWQQVTIPDVTLPIGSESAIEIRGVTSDSNVAVSRLEYGDTEMYATSHGWELDEPDDNDWDDNCHNDYWDGNYGYMVLDWGDTTVALSTSEDGSVTMLDGWQIDDDGAMRGLQDADLGQRFSQIDMGEGTDWVVGAAGTSDNMEINLTKSIWQDAENVLGGGGDDILVGNGSGNLLAGGDGNDVLVSGGSKDYLVGGSGDDEMHYDIDDIQTAGLAEDHEGYGMLDQAIREAYEANDLDGAEALESLRAGVDGGSGNDTLKLTGGDGGLSNLTGSSLANAASNIEILDVTGVDGPVDMSLSVDDLIQMTDDRDELKILKDGDDTVKVGDTDYGVGEHTISVDGVDFKLVIEDKDPTVDV